MASIFTKIIKREIPAYIIFENTTTIAFLDILPLQPGHTLVVPKKQVDYFFDLDGALLTQLVLDAQVVASAIKKAMNCKRVSVNIYGFDVPHAHVHLIPSNSQEDLNFLGPRFCFSEDELSDIAKKIISYT